MTVHILANPDREAKRLITVLKQCPIQKHEEKDPMLRRFPKTLTRGAFPKYSDREMKNLWELFTPDDANPSSQTNKNMGVAPGKDIERNLERERLEKEREREALIEEKRQRELMDMEKERAAYEQELERQNERVVPEYDYQQSEPPTKAGQRPAMRAHMRQQSSDERGLKRTKSKASTVRHYEDDHHERDPYESMPPPPLPNNGVERERKPYARGLSNRKEDVTLHDSDEEYLETPHGNSNFARPRANTRTSNVEAIDPYSRQIYKTPTHQPYPHSSSEPSPPPGAKYSDLDREEEDLYQMMAAKQAEIAAIEERLSRQRVPAKQAFSSNRISQATLDQDEEEARERLQRAEDDWEREERERKRWAEAGRHRYESDYGHDTNRDSSGGLGTEEYTVGTPISQYSWRDSYGGAPVGPGGKRATTGGGRISGGGEWEEFKYDEVSPIRTRKDHIEPERW